MELKKRIVAAVVLGIAALIAWIASHGDGTERAAEAATADASIARGTSAELVADPSASSEASVSRSALGESDPSALHVAHTTTTNDRAYLRVELVAKETKLPLAGWSIACGRGDPALGLADGLATRAERPETTDANGRALVDVPANLHLTLLAWCTPNATAGAPIVDVIQPVEASATRDARYETETAIAFTMWVRVLDRVDRASIVGARVAARRPSSLGYTTTSGPERIPDPPLAYAVTDRDGLCRIEIPSGACTYVDVDVPEHGRALAAVYGGHETPERALEVVVARAAAVRGRIVGGAGGRVVLRADSGDLVKQGTFTTFGHVYGVDAAWSCDVGADERFELPRLPARCNLTVAWIGGLHELARPCDDLFLEPGETREVTWRRVGACVVRGTVQGANAEPAADREVWLVRNAGCPGGRNFEDVHGGFAVARTRTDVDGRFELGGVRVGTWCVGVAAERDDPPAGIGVAMVGVCERLVVGERDREREVVLRVEPGHYVTGEVRDAAGSTVSGAEVLCTIPTMRTAHAPDGRFRLGPLPRGRCTLVARAEGRVESDPVEVDAGAEGVVLHLNRGGKIVGTIGGPTDDVESVQLEFTRLVPDGDVTWFAQARTGSSFESPSLLPAAYAVTARTPKGAFAILEDVVVRDGDNTHVDVHLAPGARVRVRTARDGCWIVLRSGSHTIGVHELDANESAESFVPAGTVQANLTRYVLRGETWIVSAEAVRTIELVAGETREIVFDE